MQKGMCCDSFVKVQCWLGKIHKLYQDELYSENDFSRFILT